MKKLLTLSFLLLCSAPLFPCGNEYGHTLNGQEIYSPYIYLAQHHRGFDKESLKSRLAKLEMQIANGEADYKTWSDIALNLMKLGQSDSALSILQPLALKHPNEYNVLANLGTCYELVGQLDSALKYISTGLKMNSESHRGSEWIHVKILEAKILEKRYPGWMSLNEIIKTEDLVARVDTTKLRNSLYEVNSHFIYQIRTRAPFTPAPNKTIANLLVSMGDFNTEIGTYENAILAYAHAIEYQESHYLDRKIKNKIRALNRKKADLLKTTEVPEPFLYMMSRSKISPDLLLMGLDEFVTDIDSSLKNQRNLQDSLHLLQLQLDSVRIEKEETLKWKEQEYQGEKKRLYYYFALAFALGVAISLLLVKRKS